jgi:hypothetical protein
MDIAPTPNMSKHKQSRIHVPGTSSRVSIDVGMIDLIRAVWAHGIETVFSCQDMRPNPNEQRMAYVTTIGYADASAFFAAAVGQAVDLSILRSELGPKASLTLRWIVDDTTKHSAHQWEFERVTVKGRNEDDPGIDCLHCFFPATEISNITERLRRSTRHDQE